MAAITSAHDWMFGIQLPIQTLTRTLVDPWEDTATVDDLVAVESGDEADATASVDVGPPRRSRTRQNLEAGEKSEERVVRRSRSKRQRRKKEIGAVEVEQIHL